MRTITAEDMARIAESLARKGCKVNYEIDYSDRISASYKGQSITIMEGESYASAMDKAQKLTRIIYETSRRTNQENCHRGQP